jgi:hypothetical protein
MTSMANIAQINATALFINLPACRQSAKVERVKYET